MYYYYVLGNELGSLHIEQSSLLSALPDLGVATYIQTSALYMLNTASVAQPLALL